MRYSRTAGRIVKPAPTSAKAIAAGLSVSVVNVPYNAMTNRHDYPNSPDGTYKALAVI